MGYAIPTTSWLELMRRSLIGNVAEAFPPTLTNFSNGQLPGILFGLTVLFAITSIFAFCWAIILRANVA